MGTLLNMDYDGGEFILKTNTETIIDKIVGNSYIFDVGIEHKF